MVKGSEPKVQLQDVQGIFTILTTPFKFNLNFFMNISKNNHQKKELIINLLVPVFPSVCLFFSLFTLFQFVPFSLFGPYILLISIEWLIHGHVQTVEDILVDYFGFRRKYE